MRAVRLLILVAAVGLTFGAESAAQAVTARVSVTGASTQANDASSDPETDEAGNLVAFTSWATNLVTDTNGVTDVFVRNRLTNVTSRVSVSTAGVQANDFSGSPALSDNGRYVAFSSFATNLVASDTNGVYDVFVRDLQLGTTLLISFSTSNAQANADSSQPSISDDGRYVAFTSQATNLASPDADGDDDVFLRDRDTDADGIYDEFGAVSTTLVSVNSSGTDSGNHLSFSPVISGNGRYVAFNSYASDLGPADTNGFGDAYVRDLQTGTTVRVSESSSGVEGDQDSYPSAISDTGRYVTFVSWATNMVAGDTNGGPDVFYRDRDTDADGIFDEAGAVSTVRVNVSSAGAQANAGTNNEARLSGDGLFVLFTSPATNLVSGDTNGADDVFLRNMLTGQTTRVSVDSSGTEGNGVSAAGDISGNGCTFIFTSDATNLVTGDTNGFTDVFVAGGDKDGDALCDDWETSGIDYDGDGTVDLALNSSPFNANMNHKDLFVEIDWMDCTVGGCVPMDTHNHQPLAGALTDVTNSFAAAPVTNPDGQNGITLHLMTDEAVREIEPVLFSTQGAGTADDFNDLKQGNPVNPCGTGSSDGRFGTSSDRSSGNCANILGARRLSFRYAIFGHNWTPGVGSAGVAELPGNDFLVTLGGWNATAISVAGGQRETEAGTFMHEMGHTLNLRHGGGTDGNCKPNYLSIMSYALIYKNMDSTRPLDYSRQLLIPLNESSLSEPAGIGGPAGRRTIYGTGGVAHWWYANTGVDWNYDTDTTDLGLAVDISRIDSIGGCGANPGETHIGHNDWANIRYSMRSSADFADGPRTTVPSWYEQTGDEIVTAAAGIDEDEDGFSNADDNCPGIANASQMNTDGDVQGDMCDNCPSAPNSGQENADGDMQGDACDLCPVYYTNWMVPAGDGDCDGFTDADEGTIGTDPGDPCADDSLDDAWPADFDNNNVINIFDLNKLTPPVFGTTGTPGSHPEIFPRRDLAPNGTINIFDLNKVTPPVFGSPPCV